MRQIINKHAFSYYLHINIYKNFMINTFSKKMKNNNKTEMMNG